MSAAAQQELVDVIAADDSLVHEAKIHLLASLLVLEAGGAVADVLMTTPRLGQRKALLQLSWAWGAAREQLDARRS